MDSQTLADFVNNTSRKNSSKEGFSLESSHLLAINLNGKVWTKSGSMIAYLGNVKFVREGMLEGGISKFLKKAISGEGTQLTKAEGNGTVYVAEHGKKISILTLGQESLYVNGNDVLAFEDHVAWDITMMRKVSGMLSGGLFNMKFTGPGTVAITTHYEPMTLLVEPGKPVTTDPNATVAWSGTLQPELVTDISFKTLIGRGSGESIQMRFSGSGFVVVQPFEEVYLQQGQ